MFKVCEATGFEINLINSLRVIFWILMAFLLAGFRWDFFKTSIKSRLLARLKARNISWNENGLFIF